MGISVAGSTSVASMTPTVANPEAGTAAGRLCLSFSLADASAVRTASWSRSAICISSVISNAEGGPPMLETSTGIDPSFGERFHSRATSLKQALWSSVGLSPLSRISIVLTKRLYALLGRGPRLGSRIWRAFPFPLPLPLPFPASSWDDPGNSACVPWLGS